MREREYIVSSGTGRTGTTFLVELLTALGMDTGVGRVRLTGKKEIANAGLEYDIRKNDAPYIVKNPAFCDFAHEVLQREDILIEHVFIPIRDLSEAAESRRRVSKENVKRLPVLQRVEIALNRVLLNRQPKPYSGGLWSTNRAGDQEPVLLAKLYNLLVALSESEVPVTLIQYPKHLKESRYLFNKLSPIFGDPSTTSLKFTERRPPLI